MPPIKDLYGGRNPVDLPAYTLTEAAHHVRLPRATIRAWALGQPYPTTAGQRRSEPVIQIADPVQRTLSFRNLVELHVLKAIRRTHKIRLEDVRDAVAYLKGLRETAHPLADVQLLTDNINLFVEHLGQLLNATHRGQVSMESILETYLKRIDRDPKGVPIKLYPFTRDREVAEVRAISIDPRVRFGQPCIDGTNIPTSIIAERHQAGDSVQELADDYGVGVANIEEALRYESRAA